MVDLTELCISYASEADRWHNECKLMTGLMLMWLTIAMIEFVIIRVKDKMSKCEEEEV